MSISVTILCKNGASHLFDVLDALKPFDEVILYDNGSTDSSIAIASQFSNVVIHSGAFYGFGPTHNIVTKLAKNNWILSVDTDEIVTEELAKEIIELKLNELESGQVYSIPRKNIYNGRWIKWCGWHPDRQIRLFNREATSFSEHQVHEGVKREKCTVVELKNPLIHYSYGCTADFLDKMQHYSELFAVQNKGKKKATLWTALWHGFFAFFKSYIIKRGIMGGYEGFIISVYNGNTAFYKYIKLREYNREETLR